MNLEEYEKMFQAETSYFWFRAKQELVKKLISKISLPPEPEILDLGAGTGINLKNLSSLGFAVGVDYSLSAIEFCQRRGLKNLVLAKAEELPFKKASFDLITCLDLLEHLEDDEGFLRECQRILKPGGFLLISTPAYQWLFSSHDIALGHKRRYSKKELKNKLEQAGFKIEILAHFFGAVFPFLLPLRLFQKFTRSRQTIPYQLPEFLNQFLFYLCRAESYLFPTFSLPLGTSLIALARVKT